MNKIGNTYASALLQLANESNKVDLYNEQLHVIDSLFDETNLKTFDSVEFSKNDQKEVLKEVLEHKIEDNLLQFLYVLIDNRRLMYLHIIVECFAELVDQQYGIVRASVISARSFNDELMQKLQVALSKKLNKTVILNNTVDPKLIAGFTIDIAGKMYDYSLNSQINQLKHELKKGV